MLFHAKQFISIIYIVNYKPFSFRVRKGQRYFFISTHKMFALKYALVLKLSAKRLGSIGDPILGKGKKPRRQ